MIVICEECSQKYRIDVSKIKGRAASFKCRGCGHEILVAKSRSVSPAMAESRDDIQMANLDIETGRPNPAAHDGSSAERSLPAARGIGLKTKMLLLFFVVPLCIVAGTTFFCLWQFESTSRSLAAEITAIAAEAPRQNGDLQSQERKRFTDRVNIMLARSEALMEGKLMVAAVVFSVGFLLFGILVWVFARRLTGRIKALTGVAERISQGGLDGHVDTESGDEIGNLAVAVAKIQQRLRLSLERLRQR